MSDPVPPSSSPAAMPNGSASTNGSTQPRPATPRSVAEVDTGALGPPPPPADPRIARNWMRAILPSALFGIMGLIAGLSTGHNGVATRAIFAVFCAVMIAVLLGWAALANRKLVAHDPGEPPRP